MNVSDCKFPILMFEHRYEFREYRTGNPCSQCKLPMCFKTNEKMLMKLYIPENYLQNTVSFSKNSQFN